MTEGWQCPKCSRCYAPTTAECKSCNDAVMVAKAFGQMAAPVGFNVGTRTLEDYDQKPRSQTEANIPFEEVHGILKTPTEGPDVAEMEAVVDAVGKHAHAIDRHCAAMLDGVLTGELLEELDAGIEKTNSEMFSAYDRYREANPIEGAPPDNTA